MRIHVTGVNQSDYLRLPLQYRPIAILPTVPSTMTTVLNQSTEERSQEEARILKNIVYDEENDRLDKYLVEEVRKYRLLWDSSGRGYCSVKHLPPLKSC